MLESATAAITFCADEDAHRSAMSLAAAYIVTTESERDPHEFVPEGSRQARAVPLYAVFTITWTQRIRRAGRQKPIVHWLVAVADTTEGLIRHLLFAVVLPNGVVVVPRVEGRL